MSTKRCFFNGWQPDGRTAGETPATRWMVKFRAGLIFLIGIIVLLFSIRSHAAPVFGKIFELLQPDGSTVEVKIWGDEFYQVVETLDGYTLVQEPDSGEICYAVLSGSGDELVSTGIPAGTDPLNLPAGLDIAPHIRINRTAAVTKVNAARNRFIERENRIKLFAATGPAPEKIPTVGSVRGLCLIIDFPNEGATIPASEVDDFCNKVGYTGYGNHGSVRDYFYDVSDGRLVYTNYVSPTYYTARHFKSYYEDTSVDPLGIRAEGLVFEALYNLELNGFDFSQYDSDHDGYIDAVNCFYVGNVRGINSGLWPHSWVVDDFEADGVRALQYQISDMGNKLTLYTFCHENGHMICDWPDLYDRNFNWNIYDYDSVGVGEYCLMAAYDEENETNPVEPCAYFKYIADWADIEKLDEQRSDLELDAGVNRFYWFQNPQYNNELYLVSCRMKTGRDSGLPDEGLALWHIDIRGSNDNQQMRPDAHYFVTLVQADGRWDLEKNMNEGDSSDLFDDDRFNRCTPFTNPNTNFWDGSSSAMCIGNIRLEPDQVFFDYDTAYPIEIVTATASGSLEDQGPENTVNGSGMSNDMHSTVWSGMWLSPESEPGTAWILYRFDKPYMLYQMWVWNYNDELPPRTGAGLKDVLIEYSLDGGQFVTLEGGHVFADAPNAANYEHNTVVDFGGVIAKYVRLTALSNWGNQSRYGLGEVRFMRITDRARQPWPAQDAEEVDLDVTLQWVAGRQAAGHNVYFSSDIRDVMDSQTPVATTEDSSYGPLTLDRNTTYYWRVDEVNDAGTQPVWDGVVWSFTTGDYYVVEDFESYSDMPLNEVWNTWVDGWGDVYNGSLVELESWIVHGGGQSMFFEYGQYDISPSEVKAAIDNIAVGTDWTVGSPDTLSLWFYGDYWNDVENVEMYVKLNGFRAYYAGDMNALTETFWHRWDINLDDFGILLNKISTITIGIKGGYGWLYFDDIRLYSLHK